MKVKKKFLLLIISSLLLIVFVVYKQYDNIKALYISSIFSADDIKAKLEDNKEKLDKYISIVDVDKTKTEDKDNIDNIQDDVTNNQNDISDNIVNNNMVNDNKNTNNNKHNEINNNDNKNKVDASNKGQNLTSENKYSKNSDNSNLENTKTNKVSNNKNIALNVEDKNNKRNSNVNVEDKTNGNNTDKNNTDDNAKDKTDDNNDNNEDGNDTVNKDKDNNCLTKDVIISKYINKMYAVKNEFVKKLKEIEKLAITEYSKLDKKDKTIKNKKDIVMKYYDLVANLEVQCDNKVNNLMIKLTEELKNIDEDTEIVKEIKDYYQNEKTLKKAYYIKKLNKKTD